MRSRNFSLNRLGIFLGLWIFQTLLFSVGSAAEEEKGLVYYVVDRSGAVITHQLTESVRHAITGHASQLPEETEVRLVFFSRQGTEVAVWPRMNRGAKREFAEYFRQNFVPATISQPRSATARGSLRQLPGGPKRLYDTVYEAMEDLQASRDRYQYVNVLVFSDGEDNWSNRFRSWHDIEPAYRQLASRHENSFVYWITLEFDPADPPPSWVRHRSHPPGKAEIAIPEPPPQANFVSNRRQVRAGEPVRFRHVARGGAVERFEWDFGDGRGSTEQNPEHRFEREGLYSVSLRVIGSGGEAEEVRKDFIQVAAVVPLTARMGPLPERIQVGETLRLEDYSEGEPESWQWLVDGEPLSSEPRAELPLEEAGEFEIALRVGKQDEEDIATTRLTVLPPPPIADFEVRPEESTFGETVVFAAGETQDDWEHRWTIDGEVTLTGSQVEWTSDRYGLLRVVHVVEGPGGLSRETDGFFVHEPPEILPSAQFAMTSRFFHQGETITFRAEETGDGWNHHWVVDGEVLGEGPEWSWEADRTGQIVIIHRIETPDTSGYFEEKRELVGQDHGLVQVAFSTSRESGVFPLKVDFTDESDGLAAAYFWDFGDGNTSTERNPTHTYREAGNYAVVLSVTNPQGRVTSNVTPVSIAVAPPMPFWQKVLIGAVAAVIVWVWLIVPNVLRPLFALEKGTKLVGARTYYLHGLRERGVSRFFWPKTKATIGTIAQADIRVSTAEGKRENLAVIARTPGSSSYSIRPIRDGAVFKFEKRTSLTAPESEEKVKVTRARILKDGESFEIGGERMTWCKPVSRRVRRPVKRGALARA